MIVCPDCREPLELDSQGYVCGACDRVYPFRGGVPCFAEDAAHTSIEFREEYFKDLYDVESRHFWFYGRRELIYRLVWKYYRDGMRTLELGSGAGNVVGYLNGCGMPFEGADVFLKAIELARTRVKTHFYQLDMNKLPFRDEFHIIGIFDVLEHISDDTLVLRSINEALRDEGLLFITVPARKKLWGRFDEVSCHKRRYERDELVALLQSTGFRVLKASYYFFFLYPFYRLMRSLNRGKGRELRDEVKIYPVINAVFRLVMFVEARIASVINLPAGSSLVIVAVKTHAHRAEK
ncbi:MAG: methyltransferase domain-containing protein [bacterium]